MATVQIKKIGLIVTATLSESSLAEVPQSPIEVAENLAALSAAVARRERLNYFPPLEYLYQRGAISDTEWESLGNYAKLIRVVGERLSLSVLRGVFSSVAVIDSQSIMLQMPNTKMRDPDALVALAHQFDARRLRLSLALSRVIRNPGADPLATAARMALPALGHWFEQVEAGRAYTL